MVSPIGKFPQRQLMRDLCDAALYMYVSTCISHNASPVGELVFFTDDTDAILDNSRYTYGNHAYRIA